MKRNFPWLGLVVLAGLGVWWWQWTKPARLIPGGLAASVPGECRQLVVVRVREVNQVPSEVWLMERDDGASRWRTVSGPLAANAGKRGIGWGLGEPALPNPGGYPDKKEGDGRSPAGIFRLPFAFGTTPQPPPSGAKLPWRECTPTLRGVDDVKSKYYNQVVDEAAISDKDWNSAEVMRREDGLYDTGVMIGHNAGHVPGGGSCIFLHLWSGPGKGTAGCIALPGEDVRHILAWLDPAREPRMVIAVP